MAFFAFTECSLAAVRISIRSWADSLPGTRGTNEGWLELLRCAVLFFPSLSGCQDSVVCEIKAIICTMAYPLSRRQFLFLTTAPCSLLRVMLNGRVSPYRLWYVLVVIWLRLEVEVEASIAREGLLRRRTLRSACILGEWGFPIQVKGSVQGCYAYNRREIVGLVSWCRGGGIDCRRLVIEWLLGIRSHFEDASDLFDEKSRRRSLNSYMRLGRALWGREAVICAHGNARSLK